MAESLALLVLGAFCGGLGHGLAFRADMAAVNGAAPPQHRDGTISAYFIVAYLGISLPMVDVGALTLWLGLKDAGLVFTACLLVLSHCPQR